MDVTQKVNTLIAISSRLVVVMTREIDVLRSMAVDELKALQPEKKSLTDRLEELVAELAEDMDAFGAVETAVREELGAVVDQVHDVAQRNERLLNAARLTNRRLIEAVVQAVKEKEAATSVYGESGEQSSIGSGHGADSLSISLDQQL